MLFPFNSVVHNLTSSTRWTSSDAGISAGNVRASIGSPDIFRLRSNSVGFSLYISDDN